MGTIDSLKSVLTPSALDDLCEKYYIPDAVHLELPDLERLFFWVDASIFPLSSSWHSGKTLRKDPPPTPDKFSAEVCDFLADNPSPFKKFLEAFLCLVGISRHYTLDENYYLTIWDDKDEDMDLFAFIHHADPTKVKVGERVSHPQTGPGQKIRVRRSDVIIYITQDTKNDL
uniref:Transposase (Putative), gypsy type n=1 Tax=Tanacetum cinerariifolium TaxID=118510 RepID=A0A699GUB3_TANCI|nr:transposase (putative), gypsy type [Tanacetum cinerariifolium]